MSSSGRQREHTKRWNRSASTAKMGDVQGDFIIFSAPPKTRSWSRKKKQQQKQNEQTEQKLTPKNKNKSKWYLFSESNSLVVHLLLVFRDRVVGESLRLRRIIKIKTKQKVFKGEERELIRVGSDDWIRRNWCKNKRNQLQRSACNCHAVVSVGIENHCKIQKQKGSKEGLFIRTRTHIKQTHSVSPCPNKQAFFWMFLCLDLVLER